MKTIVKTAKTANMNPTRRQHVFSLTAKAKLDDLVGQRAAVAAAIKKNGGATRSVLIAALPAISAKNISWYLSMLVGAKLVKKTAQK